jgi:hypothetical protein
MANKIYDIEVRIRGDQEARQGLDSITEAEKKRKKAFEEANKSANQGLQSTQGHISKLSGIAKMAGVALAGLFAVDKIKDFTQEVFKTTATFQKFEAVLTNTLGSRSEAQKAMKQINDFASSTPFAVEELTESFVKLANAGFKPTTEEMRKLGDLASATGKKFDQLTEAILDAQSFEFERLKEFGIKASQNGDKIAFSFKGVTTEVAKTNDAVRAYILSLGDLKGVSGGMAAISKTLEGQLSNLGDTFDQLKLAVGERFKDAFSEALNISSSFLNTIKDLIEIPFEEKIESERNEFTALVKALQDTNVQGEARTRIINELQSKYGEYIDNINLEKASYEDLEKTLKNVNIVFEKKRILGLAEQGDKKLAEELNELYAKQAEAIVAVQRKLEEYKKAGMSEKELQDRKEILKSYFGLSEIENRIAKIKQEQLEYQKALNSESLDKFGISTKTLKLERDRLDFLKKEEEEVFAASRKYAEEQAKKADEERKKEAKLAEEARKRALEEQKRLLEEKARQAAEFRLRELKAEQELALQEAEFRVARYKEALQAENLSVAEKISLQESLARAELAVIEEKNKQAKIKYEIDKNNAIKTKKLTNSEILLIERQTEEESRKILSDKEKKKQEIFKKSLEEQKKALDEANKAKLDAIEKEVEATKRAEEEKQRIIAEGKEWEKRVIEATFNFGQSLGQAAFEFDRINSEAKLQNLKAKQEEELRLAGNNEQNKQFIMTKFANEEKKIKEGQARAEKNKALFDIAINTALAVVKSLATSPQTFGLPFSAFAITQGAIQAALVASRPIPKFKEGVEMLKGPGTETSDSILARLSAGERVVSAKTNKAYFPALSAIHNGLVPPEAINSFVKDFTNQSENTLKNEIKALLSKVDKLASALENQSTHYINIDENGINHYISSRNQTEQFLNKRYSL